MLNVFKLFANCIPVKGYFRSIVYDLQRNEYHLIPNSLFEILNKFDGCSIEQIQEEYNQEYNEIIEEYFDFLKKNEIVFNTKNPDLFPSLNLRWDTPSVITNAILCFKDVNYDHKAAIAELEELGCKAIQLRFFRDVTPNELDKLLNIFIDKRIQDIEIILPYNDSYDEEKLNYVFLNNVRITKVLFFNAPVKKEIIIEKNVGLVATFIEPELINNNFCGVINPLNFTTNLNFFSEAQSHNSCLNRKISIDEYGAIKNCPSMNTDYGNISENSIKEVVTTKKFQRIWNTNKDNIKICKDCEFRYMCLDCRAYLGKDEEKQKPVKCGYNPYIGKWSTQDGYISAEEWIREKKS